ncbi:hypothetical protein ACFPRL_09375 [Pseudoclavibacter helvolus]
MQVHVAQGLHAAPLGLETDTDVVDAEEVVLVAARRGWGRALVDRHAHSAAPPGSKLASKYSSTGLASSMSPAVERTSMVASQSVVVLTPGALPSLSGEVRSGMVLFHCSMSTSAAGI